MIHHHAVRFVAPAGVKALREIGASLGNIDVLFHAGVPWPLGIHPRMEASMKCLLFLALLFAGLWYAAMTISTDASGVSPSAANASLRRRAKFIALDG